MPQGTRAQRDRAIAGATAGVATVALLHPLDVFKTRLQVQDGSGLLPSYKGMTDVARKLWNSSGFRGLYAGRSSVRGTILPCMLPQCFGGGNLTISTMCLGIVPSMLGSGAAWGTYFYFYGLAKRRRTTSNTEVNTVTNLLSATEAGLIVSVLTNPIWVVKTRLQLQESFVRPEGLAANQKVTMPLYSGTLDCLRSIVRAEGLGGLYRGLVPSLILVSHGAIQLAIYENLKNVVQGAEVDKKFGGSEGRHTSNRISAIEAGACGALSKAAATMITYPSQVIRSRLQQRMDTRDLKYTGFVSSVRVTLQREGAGGLYKGLVPNLLRVMPQSAVTFLIYEAVMNLLNGSAQH